jgi:hypothetical protein
MSRGEFMVEASWDGLNEKTIWTIKNSKKSLKKFRKILELSKICGNLKEISAEVGAPSC